MTMHRAQFGIACVAAGALVLDMAAAPWVLAAEAARDQSASYREAYDAAQQKYAPSRREGGPDFPAARALFRQAVDLAATDQEKAEAILGLGRAFLADVAATDDAAARAALRGEYARILTLPALTPAQRAEAHLGMAETYLGDRSYEAVRDACARAREASAEAVLAARARMVLARCCVQERNLPAARLELQRLLDIEGGDPQLGWEAEALLGAIRVLPVIRAEHPRLFLNADTWPAAKERALTVEKALFDQMTAQMDRLSIQDIRSGNYALRAMDAAFVYRVTGDRALLEKVRRMLRATVDVLAQRRPEDDRAYYGVAWSAALDWVWNDLTAEERTSLAGAMARNVCSLTSERKVIGRLAIWPHYYPPSVPWYVGVALLDPEADDVQYARAVSLLGIGLKQHEERFASLIGTAGDQGVWQTNIEYDLVEVPNAVWGFLYSWQPATGQAMPEEWAMVGVAPGFALRMLVGMGPGHFKHFNYAGHSNGAWGRGQVYSSALYDHLGNYINLFGQSHPEEAAIAAYLRQRMVETGAGPAEGKYPVFRFLAADLEKAPPPVLPRGLPLARFYTSVGLVLMSSGFGPDDTYALFSQGGGVAGRRHDYNAAHFTLYKKGFLALDTGVRFAAGHSPNYRHQTVAHNAVIIQMPGEQFPRTQTGPATVNSGGQNRPPEEAKALAFETSRLYAYTAIDAAPVYNEAKCAQMVRQFLYLPPDHFVVFDRVVSTRPEYPKTWLLHTANEPVIAGKGFRADQAEGRIFCRTLYPLDAALEKLGGPGKEFWADGRNWPIADWWQTPGSGDWWKRYGHGATEPTEPMGRWRVEVKPGAARTEDCFLHLIQVSDQTVAKLVESRLREKGDQVELTFTANGRTHTIALNRAGDIGGHIRIIEEGKVLVDRALTREVTPQSGLALNAKE
ncbi:MAG: hypothetical protein HY321_09940 [Armatimonadetes bacterium]|nr:hypothetical protein [Armatimonadota bacterium]